MQPLITSQARQNERMFHRRRRCLRRLTEWRSILSVCDFEPSVPHPAPIPEPMTRPSATTAIASPAPHRPSSLATTLADAELVARAATDPWALDALLRRYADELIAIVTRLLGRRDEADDVVQDVFATVIADLHSLRDPSAFRSWLLGIAIRRVRRAFRKRTLWRLFGADRG